ncbi:hypothetical protein NHH03_08215 [Stieleria sp. TO1_6]|uniref:hypothetical protein n=1 Tax=Stieleria tagensis TaxID=2956795 RepID=UPI00209B03AC|nr:hypothetical protein [Stieleria tagensis]MCO8121717.1 hypothetical protein [Stieleria tagensis]
MNPLTLRVICCDDTPERHTQIVTLEIPAETIERQVLETVEQTIEAGVERGLHNAAHHPDHGPVTYFQTVHSGGFYVTVGAPDDLQESYFGPGSLVAFCDDQGPGHGSRVGPEGVQRTLRVLKGLLR